jgi:hypothetical protein
MAACLYPPVGEKTDLADGEIPIIDLELMHRKNTMVMAAKS